MDINIHVALVQQAGNDLQELAEEAKDKLAELFAYCDDAADGNEGWLSSGSLTACANAWHNQMNTVVDRLQTTGTDLVAAAATLSSEDQEAAARIHEVLTDLGLG